MKVYAKNPAPEQWLDNPAELVIQNPTPKSKKMAKRKRDKNGRFKSKKRSNPSGVVEEFTDTGKNLFMQYGLAALAATGTVKGAQYLVAQIPGIPAWAKEWGVIAGPGVAGIILTMMTDKKSAIMQGLAGGMVLATANGLSDKLINGGDTAKTNGGMADAKLGKSDMIVKPDGYLYDQQGNKIAKVSAEGFEAANPAPALPAKTGFSANEYDHSLGDYSWETENEEWAL